MLGVAVGHLERADEAATAISRGHSTGPGRHQPGHGPLDPSWQDGVDPVGQGGGRVLHGRTSRPMMGSTVVLWTDARGGDRIGSVSRPCRDSRASSTTDTSLTGPTRPGRHWRSTSRAARGPRRRPAAGDGRGLGPDGRGRRFGSAAWPNGAPEAGCVTSLACSWWPPTRTPIDVT
jgi:hypothetical protein